MRCTYKDDFKVDYSGSLHISKGDGVDLVVKESLIPTDIKSSLDSAVNHNNCHELRVASRAFTNTINTEFGKE
jgi:hypothetical protein